ncbi:MAG: hypothetical protein FWE05_12710 [Defluviitaleaceae bacterium]|nr:hypothetical protein [Defluviitaleaceae bacterium]
MLLFMMDEHGRTLSKKSTDKFLKNFMERMDVENVTSTMGPSVNDPVLLLDQIRMRKEDGKNWGVTYSFKNHYTYVLNDSEKEAFEKLLRDNQQASSYELCRRVLDKNKRI